MAQPEDFPVDASDQALLALVRPTHWVTPTPPARYNLVVVGGGAAGMVSSMIAGGLGGRAALIERHFLGGDCLNTGCVPSKALIRAGRAAHEAREAGKFGVHAERISVDFAAVMARVRAERASIATHDTAEHVRDGGVDFYQGTGRFTDVDRVEVGGVSLRFSRAVIATGGRARRPAIPGIELVHALTHEEIWNLTELPARLLVLGAGPVGCELSQAFCRLGSTVVLVDRGQRILTRDDPDAAAVVARRLVAEGVELVLGSEVVRFELDDEGQRVAVLGEGVAARRIVFDQVLIAVGRELRTEGLGLDAAGIHLDDSGRLIVDARLRTTNRRVFVAGDSVGTWQFTHAADAMARMVVRNALFFGRARVEDLVVPWATYTEPELAHVGMSAEDAAADPSIRTLTVQLADNDRAIVDGATEGFARLHYDRRDRIVGATVVGAHAGELIGTMSLLITTGESVGALAQTIFPYPTQSEVLKRLGDAWTRQRLTPFVSRALAKLLAWRR